MLDVTGSFAHLIPRPPVARACPCCRQPAPLALCLRCADAVAAIMTAFDMTDGAAALLLRAILADPSATAAFAARGQRA